MDSSVQYDAEGRISGIDYGYDYGSSSFTPTYGTSERIESWDSSGLLIRDYNYDVLQRLNSVSTKNTYGETVFSTNYTFLSGWNSSYYTTAMVESEQNSAANETLRYVYDSAGRITQVLRNNVVVYKYTYNEANGFLVREDNADAGESYVYTYDEMGNILKRFTYDFTTGALGSLSDTKTWNYNSNATFGKMFTGIDDRDDLTWDALGNVTANFESGEQFTWDGRRLACYNNGIDQYYNYIYDSNGVRIGKEVDEYGTVTASVQYYTDGTKILKEIRTDSNAVTPYGTSYEIYYHYDENDSPTGFTLNGEDYFYYKNIFGDILGIVNMYGTMVVRYTYDAWGNPVSITGSMASTVGNINPFRYRSYYYDTESGLYYLNARYYSPEWGRFISPDPVLDTSSAVGCNMFAYCKNDPVNNIDPTGELALCTILLKAVVGAAVNVLTTYIGAKVTGQSYSWEDAAVAAFTGGIGTIGTGCKIFAGAVSGLYSGVSAYKKGASIGGAVFSGVASACSTTISISNIAEWGGFSSVGGSFSSNLARSAATDLVFGTASNAIAAAVYRSSIVLADKTAKQTEDEQCDDYLNRTKLYCDKRLR